MADNFDDELALLYDDILTRLNRGESLADIDLDSLIEVYDYAYDLSDEYVTAEIMDNVLRRDPYFQPMLERKAFRYALLSEIQGAKSVANMLPDSSFIKRLIGFQTEWDASDWRNSYRRLLADVRPQSLDEYAAMCLIDLALGVDDVAHLSALLPDILPLCRYPEDFLVDLSGTLLDNNLPEQAVPVLLELTTLQPFSLDYWLQLADLYVNRLNNFEDGYSAIDYALAIDPDSGKAMMLKGDLLMKVDGYEDEVHALADRLLSMPEFRDEALYLKAGAHIKEENSDEALKYLVKYIDVCNNPLDIFVLMISLNPGGLSGEIRGRLKEFIQKADISEIGNWLSRARKIMEDENFEILLDCIVDADVPVTDEVFSIVLLRVYRSGKFTDVCGMYERRKATSVISPYDTLVYIIANLRLGKTSGMRELLNETNADVFEYIKNTGPEGKLLYVGVGKLFYDLERYFDLITPGKKDSRLLDKLDSFSI